MDYKVYDPFALLQGSRGPKEPGWSHSTGEGHTRSIGVDKSHNFTSCNIDPVGIIVYIITFPLPLRLTFSGLLDPLLTF